MRVLLSAIACEPHGGSELQVGWATVRCLARDHDLWVLTSGRSREPLERASAEGLVPKNVRFIYSGQYQEWHPNRLRARLQSWKEYLSFSRTILAVARDLHRTVQFDLAHHATYATWRVASPLWQLGIPFVFGPIGGNGKFPLRLLPMLSPAAAGFELLRMSSNVLSRLSPSVRACIRHASHIFTADAETESLVRALRGSAAGVSSLMAAFYSDARIQSFARFASSKAPGGPLRIFAGGNLIGTKGVALALHGLARAKSKGLRFRYRLGGGGPEASHLQNLAARLGLQEDVVFGEPLVDEAYRRELGATHVYLLPSLRESAGLTMMEAMLAGCVPVVANCGGPGRIVTDDCGYRIPVASRTAMVRDLADAILNLDRNREMIFKKGRAATERIAGAFTEERYREAMNRVYVSVATAPPLRSTPTLRAYS